MRCLLLVLAFATLARAQETSPPASTSATAPSKPVQVFVMLGQSNMLGFGRVGPAELQGTLENLIQKHGKYGFWKREDGSWVVRDDVRYVRVMQKGDAMSLHANEWLTVNGNFGPELGFGRVVGDALESPVLLLKSCIGNRSLGWDLLPPGSERYEFEGQIHAGYKDSPLSWPKGTEPVPIAWYAGKQYDDDVANAKKVLAELPKYYPGASSYEIAGFVWWQGHKDQNAAHASRYEQNLVQLIKMLRRDFQAPHAKFVLATIAFGGDKLAGHGLQVAEAQLAVDGRRGKYPELVGNVAAIDARPFWREVEVSPVNQGHHYNHNAETYMEVGLAMGRAMVDMLRAAEARGDGK